MGRKRIHGPLDPLFAETERGFVSELAKLLEVSRQTIYRWQTGRYEIAKFYKMQINLIAIGRGIKPPFPNARKET